MGKGIVLAAFMALGLAGCATQMPDVGSASGRMPDFTVAAAAPAGFISFCLRFADQCERKLGAATSVSLTADTWQTLTEINHSVNESIWPQDDVIHYGRGDYWTIPTDGYGDCDDYALTKRKELLAAGFPAPALRLAVADTPRSGRHAVLTVATDKGDFVLDNLRADVVAWNTTGYTWVERQNPAEPLGWVQFRQPSPMLAALQPAVGATIQTNAAH